MKKIVNLLFVMLLAQMAWAQKPKLVETSVLLLSGSDSSRLEYVTVQLLRSPDKHLAYGGISNGSGYVHFGKILPGNYLLVASCVGYQVVKKTIEVQAKERYHYNRLYLPTDVKQLQSVEVHGQQEGSKMALNKLVYIPDSLGLAHAITAFDLLSYAPGVHVKKSSKTISIMGNKKVLVMVDGRHDKSRLMSLAPQDIERIEVIDNPSAKYDSDVANVLNVVLKEERKKGLAINTWLMYFHGKTYKMSDNHLNIDYDLGKLRLFARYSYLHSNSTLSDTSWASNTIGSDSYMHKTVSPALHVKHNKHQIKYGFDYKINKKHLINITARHTIRDSKNDGISHSRYLINDALAYDLDNNKNSATDYKLSNYTLFYRGKFNKDKQKLISHTNVYVMDRQLHTDKQLDFSYANNSTTQQQISEQTHNKTLSINSKTEYTHPISKSLLLDAGAHYYYRKFDDEYSAGLQGRYFNYHDFRQAYYAQLEWEGKRWAATLGSRAEHLNFHIYDSIKRQQWHLLPNAALLYKLSDKEKLRLTLKQQLSYPSFYMLSPFVYYSNDSLVSGSGNPYLQPQRNTHIALSWSHKAKAVMTMNSLFYTQKQDIFGSRANTHANNHVSYIYDNVAWHKSYGVSSYLQMQIMQGFIFLNLFNQVSYNSFPDSDYNGWQYQCMLSAEIQLPADIYLLIDASYTNKDYLFNGYDQMRPIIDEISLNMSVFNGYGEVAVGLCEYFINPRELSETRSENYVFRNESLASAKNIMFSFSYFLSKGKRIKHEKRGTLMEEDTK